eukprot:15434484-Alexandrium_andersonii.AAC.1
MATQMMVKLLAPLSSADTSQRVTGESLRELSTLVWTAHAEASDCLRHPFIEQPTFVTYADAAWANRKDLGSQCGFLC